jgi:hypothetical protein
MCLSSYVCSGLAFKSTGDLEEPAGDECYENCGCAKNHGDDREHCDEFQHFSYLLQICGLRFVSSALWFQIKDSGLFRVRILGFTIKNRVFGFHKPTSYQGYQDGRCDKDQSDYRHGQHKFHHFVYLLQLSEPGFAF